MLMGLTQNALHYNLSNDGTHMAIYDT